MTLEQLSLRPEEIFPCPAWSGRMLVAAEVNGVPVYLILNTGISRPLMLDITYAIDHGLAFGKETASGSVGQVGVPVGVKSGSKSDIAWAYDVRVSALGRTASLPAVPAVGIVLPHMDMDPLDRPLAGLLGAGSLQGGVLALDARGNAVGFSERGSLRAPAGAAPLRLRLADLGQGHAPLTQDLMDGSASWSNMLDRPPVFLVDTGNGHSAIAYDYVQDRGTWFSRRSCGRIVGAMATLRRIYQLPTGQRIVVPMMVVPSYQSVARSLKTERIDGALGMSFLGRWISVLDFPASRLLLFDYSQAPAAPKR